MIVGRENGGGEVVDFDSIFSCFFLGASGVSHKCKKRFLS